jgi:hypothetical protein
MSSGRGEEGVRDYEVTDVALIARPHLSYRGEQSTRSVIDRRFSSVRFEERAARRAGLPY